MSREGLEGGATCVQITRRGSSMFTIMNVLGQGQGTRGRASPVPRLAGPKAPVHGRFLRLLLQVDSLGEPGQGFPA